MEHKSSGIGPLEMQVLGILNQGQNYSVAEVQAALKKSGEDLAYTTVMTVLVRLYNKDLAVREKQGRYFLYAASRKNQAFALKVFKRVTNSLFRAERLKPILNLLDAEDDLSKEELIALKKAVDSRLKDLKK